MLFRFGSALVLIGTIVLIVFVLTYSAGQADLRTLLVGAGLAVLGLMLRRRGAPAVDAEPARFRTVRRILRRPAELEEGVDPDEDS
jgi:hypothetical protein